MRIAPKVAEAGAVLMFAGLLAGCGGSASPPTTTTSALGPAQTRHITVDQLVRLDAPGSSHLQGSVVAHAGQEVEFVTLLHHEHSATVPVTLHLIQGPGGRITVTAGTSARSASATVSSPDHAPLYLVAVHYPCEIPPLPTFCPPARVASTSDGYQVKFAYTEKAPIEIYARLSARETGSKRKLHRATSAPVPPYKLSETLAPAPGPPLGSVAAVHPGQVVAIETRLGSPISGAPQPVTVSLPRGPAKAITITASVPGRRPTQARLTGAGGVAIAVSSGHFMCFLAPYPTFCPAKQSSLGSAGYRFTFDATPNTSPVRIVLRLS